VSYLDLRLRLDESREQLAQEIEDGALVSKHLHQVDQELSRVAIVFLPLSMWSSRQRTKRIFLQWYFQDQISIHRFLHHFLRCPNHRPQQSMMEFSISQIVEVVAEASAIISPSISFSFLLVKKWGQWEKVLSISVIKLSGNINCMKIKSYCLPDFSVFLEERHTATPASQEKPSAILFAKVDLTFFSVSYWSPCCPWLEIFLLSWILTNHFLESRYVNI
jgi:hypothetical protein